MLRYTYIASRVMDSVGVAVCDDSGATAGLYPGGIISTEL
jgi:hypothetical protein